MAVDHRLRCRNTCPISISEANDSEHVTIDLALAWATLPTQGAMDWWSGLLAAAVFGYGMAGFGGDGLAEFGEQDGDGERRECSRHERRRGGVNQSECTNPDASQR